MQKSPQRMREQRGGREISEISGKDSMNNGWNAPWVSKMSRNGAAAASHVSNTASALRPTMPPGTTLASSRWKDIRQINEAGFYAEEHCGRGLTRFWDRNWRKGGLYERRNILARQFYNQQYCGCEFSLRHSDKNNTLNTTQYEKATGTHAGRGNDDYERL